MGITDLFQSSKINAALQSIGKNALNLVKKTWSINPNINSTMGKILWQTAFSIPKLLTTLAIGAGTIAAQTVTLGVGALTAGVIGGSFQILRGVARGLGGTLVLGSAIISKITGKKISILPENIAAACTPTKILKDLVGGLIKAAIGSAIVGVIGFTAASIIGAPAIAPIISVVGNIAPAMVPKLLAASAFIKAGIPMAAAMAPKLGSIVVAGLTSIVPALKIAATVLGVAAGVAVAATGGADFIRDAFSSDDKSTKKSNKTSAQIKSTQQTTKKEGITQQPKIINNNVSTKNLEQTKILANKLSSIEKNFKPEQSSAAIQKSSAGIIKPPDDISLNKIDWKNNISSQSNNQFDFIKPQDTSSPFIGSIVKKESSSNHANNSDPTKLIEITKNNSIICPKPNNNNFTLNEQAIAITTMLSQLLASKGPSSMITITINSSFLDFGTFLKVFFKNPYSIRLFLNIL
jgi:hypothetical protein